MFEESPALEIKQSKKPTSSNSKAQENNENDQEDDSIGSCGTSKLLRSLSKSLNKDMQLN